MSGAVLCLCGCHLCPFHVTLEHFLMFMLLAERHHYHVNAFLFSFLLHACNYVLVTQEVYTESAILLTFVASL